MNKELALENEIPCGYCIDDDIRKAKYKIIIRETELFEVSCFLCEMCKNYFFEQLENPKLLHGFDKGHHPPQYCTFCNKESVYDHVNKEFIPILYELDTRGVGYILVCENCLKDCLNAKTEKIK